MSRMRITKVLLAAAMLICLAVSVIADEPSSWAKAEVESAVEAGFVPSDMQNSYRTPITRAEFAHCAVKMCAAYDKADVAEYIKKYESDNPASDNPSFTDLTNETREFSEYAYTLGIVKGYDNSLFKPNAPISRQEAAVMLYRAYRLCGGETEASKTVSFTDSSEIADWAINEIGAIVSAGVMHGVENNRFSPNGQYTREQCYITLSRLLNTLNEKRTADEADENTQTDSGIKIDKENFITTNYFEYALTDNGTLAVTKYIGPEGIIVMQPKLDGIAVTGIVSGAFDGMMQVCVPDSISEIEAGAFPADIKGVYYETESGAVKAYAEKEGITSALWDWNEIACIKWARRDDGIERPAPVHGTYYNNDIAYEATTMIYCERSPEDEFEYTIENDEVTVYNYIGESKYVSIPEYIEGYPVRTLGRESFENAVLCHLEIPKTVRRVEHYSCGIYSDIKTIHLLDGEECILGRNVFCGDNNHLRVHNNVSKSDESDTELTRTEWYYVTDISMAMCIVPVTYEKTTGNSLSIFCYNAN